MPPIVPRIVPSIVPRIVMLKLWARSLVGLARSLPAELPERAPRWARGSYAALRRLEIRVLFVGAAAALCGMAFLELADEVEEGPVGIDQRVFRLLHDPENPSRLVGPPGFQGVVRDFTALGSWAVVLLVIGVVALGTWAAGKRRLSALVLGACLSGLFLGPALKHVFARERPGAEFHAVETFTSSFPSGHAMNAAVVYLTLGALVAAGQRRRRSVVFALATGIGIALLVGASRVYLGVHWPTDVMAGWAAGFGWAMLWWLAADLMRAWRGPQPPPPPEVPASATP